MSESGRVELIFCFSRTHGPAFGVKRHRTYDPMSPLDRASSYGAPVGKRPRDDSVHTPRFAPHLRSAGESLCMRAGALVHGFDENVTHAHARTHNNITLLCIRDRRRLMTSVFCVPIRAYATQYRIIIIIIKRI